MKVTTLGLWHLGCVTAACCAKHFETVGVDEDAETVKGLNEGRAPLFEPGLDELISAGIVAEQLSFTTDAETGCAEADVLWVTRDTPVDEDDRSNVESVLECARGALRHLREGALVLISAQLPVGSCAKLEAEFPRHHFACSPENLRLGQAIKAFEKAERVVVGIRSEADKALIEELFKPFTTRIVFMRTESAEMVKHALNSFLALSVTFINEIARLCEHTGADADEVSAGLKSEPRIGSKAYLGPGGAFAGGTLARDVVTLTELGERHGEILSVIPAITKSNHLHRGWALQRLTARLGDLRGKVIAVLGLTYTVNTDTLRRSDAVELCAKLEKAGAVVRAFDPAVKHLPAELPGTQVSNNVAEAVNGADAAVICTEWPVFREAAWGDALGTMRQRVIVDANGFLEGAIKGLTAEHFRVGHIL